ncbi:MAG: hypothetical protein A2073_06345 [Deltaproteobacteria bacterium GWC2_42_11]|nr:MAG: hypothetical protein A2073_06345 [Deltaproteobacteria bacterium GWC2_42_11]
MSIFGKGIFCLLENQLDLLTAFCFKGFMNGESAIAVMLKAPAAGQVKTRLVPPLTNRQSAGLYRCFIKDIFARLAVINIDIFAAYTPSGTRDIIKKLVGKDARPVLQKGNNLGERLENVFRALFKKGYKKVAVIGSDSTDIPIEYIKRAFDEVEEGKIVFGPAEDGGYYLIAMHRLCDIFKDIPWSTDKVLYKSLKTARRKGIETFLLPCWHDIDTYNDLKKLVPAGIKQGLLKNKIDIPHTYNFLKKKIL